jgi:hypothetical protein
MTVETTLTKVRYAGNGSAKEFPVPFAYSRTEDLRLVLSDAAGDESVAADNFRWEVNSSGDTSLLYPVSGSPLPAGMTLTIYRDTPRTQIVDLIYGGDFDPNVLEHDGLDRLEMQMQELREESDRSVKVKISGDETPDELRDSFFQARDEAREAAGAASDSAGQAGASKNAAAASATAAAEGKEAAAASAANAADSATAASDSKDAAAASATAANNSGKAAASSANAAAASAVNAANSSTRAVDAADGAAGVAAAVTAKLDGMIGLLNNFFGMAMECCGSLEDYRFVYEAATDGGDYGSLTEAAGRTDDWGGLRGLFA